MDAQSTALIRSRLPSATMQAIRINVSETVKAASLSLNERKPSEVLILGYCHCQWSRTHFQQRALTEAAAVVSKL